MFKWSGIETMFLVYAYFVTLFFSTHASNLTGNWHVVITNNYTYCLGRHTHLNDSSHNDDKFSRSAWRWCFFKANIIITILKKNVLLSECTKNRNSSNSHNQMTFFFMLTNSTYHPLQDLTYPLRYLVISRSVNVHTDYFSTSENFNICFHEYKV